MSSSMMKASKRVNAIVEALKALLPDEHGATSGQAGCLIYSLGGGSVHRKPSSNFTQSSHQSDIVFIMYPEKGTFGRRMWLKYLDLFREAFVLQKLYGQSRFRTKQRMGTSQVVVSIVGVVCNC